MYSKLTLRFGPKSIEKSAFSKTRVRVEIDSNYDHKLSSLHTGKYEIV